MAKEKGSSKTKVHTRYYDENKVLLPGTTTITGMIPMPGLVWWYYGLGKDGVDAKEFLQELADIGSLGHYLCVCDLLKETPDTSVYSQYQIDKAENCYLKFCEWKKGYDIEPIYCEKPLVSNKYKFGGTLDLYVMLNGKKAIIEMKSSPNIYESHKVQVCAHKQLVEENGGEVDELYVLRIGRDETEGFDFKRVYRIEEHWQVFLDALKFYNSLKIIKKNS